MSGSWSRSPTRLRSSVGSRRAISRRTWSAWRALLSLSRRRAALARSESHALLSQAATLATRRGLLLSQVLQTLGDDPSAILPELALIMYEDAIAHAQQLVAWPTGKGQGLKKSARITELQRSPLPEQRLAAALYQDYLSRKKLA